MTTILHKRGSGIPTADKFEAVGEILIDSETGIAYTLNDAGEVVPVGGDALWEQSGSDLYYSAGNVGIGVTPLGSSSGAFTQLQIGGGSGQSTLFGQNNDHAIGMASGAYYDASNNLKYSSSAKGLSRLYLYDGTFQFSSAPSGTEGATATLTERMRIDGATGNVGIGADVTTFRFNVETSNSTTTNLKSTSEISNLRLTNSGGLAVVGSEGNDLVFSASTNEKMRIGSDGSVKVVSKADGQELTISQGYNSYMYASNDLYLGAGGDSELAVLKGNGNAFFSGTVQAADYLDADGNSIIGVGGGGGGGDLDWVNNDEDKLNISLGWDNTPSSRGVHQVLLGSEVKAKEEGVAIGRVADAGDHAVAVGLYASASFNGIAIGNQADAGDDAISLGSYASAVSGEFAIGTSINAVNFSGATVQATDYLDADGNPATVSPSRMVDAFTTLQNAIADETTIEGIKTALTNSLGGLIEKFEGMKNG